MKFRNTYKINKPKNLVFQRNLIATALLANGFFQFLSPVLAQTAPTPAGTPIDNRATATYEDPNNPNIPISSTSNTVTVTVAEVAGISVVAGTPVDNNGGTIQSNDLIYFPFTITNIGNDPTRFQIPTQAAITGPGIQGTLQYSSDGTTWTDVPAGGFTTTSIPVNGTIQVRVPVTINSGVTAGQTIKVTLGETATPETNANSPRAGSVNDARDIYTVDNLNGTPGGEVTGTPANSVVEGSAAASITISSKSYSLATILKTRPSNGYNNNGTPNDITDDTITHNLSLQVRSTDNTGQNITPSPLAGSDVPGLPGKNILVSDAIPFGTELAAAPTSPTGWTVVYSTTSPSTPANAATWTTTAPTLSTVTRIGFVKATIDGNTSTYLPAADAQLTSFSIQLKVKAGQTAPLTIANIAQVFGKTPDTNTPVLDESGDQNPSNFDGPPGNMTPPLTTDPNGDGVPDKLPDIVPNGYLDDPKTNPSVLNTAGTDSNNNNTGQGSGGEANVFVIYTTTLLNGPNGQPDAVGPTNNNDDFTNKSSNVPANIAPGSTFDPNVVNFNNTIRNSGTQADNISLLPTPPVNAGDLPNGTVVTISANNGATTATYTYNNGVFTFTNGTGTSANNPVRIDGVATGATANYTVDVDLPNGTQLSTDPGFERGFPVPITAFIDTDANGVLNIGEVANITIDRVYTGYLQLIKQSRILQGTGPAVQGIDGTLSTTAKTPAPGNIVEYVIQYKNISEPPPASGSNNVILNAGSVVITEDGTTLPNNWARDNDNNNVVDTSHVADSAQASEGTIEFFSGDPATTPATNATSGTTAATDVTRYVNNVGTVAPGTTPGTFTFRRKVN